MKYDCSKILDYRHEWNRMCDAIFNEGCDNCPIKEAGESCYHIHFITQKHIEIIQKWSNEHPEKTRKQAFLEIFPKADVRLIGINKACFGYLIGEKCGDAKGREIGCEGCWNRPYNGEFEKAREK